MRKNGTSFWAFMRADEGEKMWGKFNKLWIIGGLLFFLCLISVSVSGEQSATEKEVAAEKQSATEKEVAAEKKVAEKTFPGVSEVVPRSTVVAEEAALAEKNLVSLQNISDLEEKLQALKKEQDKINNFGSEIKATPEPNYDQTLFFRNQVTKQGKSLEGFAAEVSARLSQVDAINQKWQKKKDFWGNWKKALREKYQETHKDIPQSAPATAFREAEKAISDILNASQETFDPLLTLQKELSSLQEMNHAHVVWMEAKFGEIRKNLFIKNAPSFKNPEFYNQFGPSLFAEFLEGYRSLGKLEDKYFQDYSWIVALQVALALIITFFIINYRGRMKEAEEWRFFCEHPVAAGFFISFITLSFLYAGVPSLLRLIVWVVAATSISFIISSILKDKRKIFLIFLVAFLSILTLFLQTISFPQPLFRLFRAGLCLLGIPFLWRLSKIKVEPLADKSHIISCLLNASWLFKVGTGVLVTALLAEVGGFVAFSSWLLESSVFSVFILIFSAMAVRLGEGAVVYIASRIQFPPRSFLDNIKEQVTARVKLLVRIVPVVYAGLYLLKMWMGSKSLGAIWDSIMGFRITFGNVDLSVYMVLMAVLFIYLSLVASWVLGLFFDKEVFPKKRVSRGVKDLVKKLIHYSLILVGFLMALGALGLDLQNFAVLAGAFGIGIGFGLQNIVNNFVSGLILLFERPITVGDIIVFQGEWGTVRRIGLRSTVVETYDRSEIIVPNSQLVSEAVVNWTLSTPTSRIILSVGVAYGTDIEKVLGILEKEANNHQDVLSEPAPWAMFSGFGESSLDFELRAWVGSIDNRFKVKSDLGKAINLRFKEEGVEIPFPQRDLHLRSVDKKAGRAIFGQSVPRKASPSPVAGDINEEDGMDVLVSAESAKKRKDKGPESGE
jgi:potassium-dependent mechanosensitive channel